MTMLEAPLVELGLEGLHSPAQPGDLRVFELPYVTLNPRDPSVGELVEDTPQPPVVVLVSERWRCRDSNPEL